MKKQDFEIKTCSAITWLSAINEKEVTPGWYIIRESYRPMGPFKTEEEAEEFYRNWRPT